MMIGMGGQVQEGAEHDREGKWVGEGTTGIGRR